MLLAKQNLLLLIKQYRLLGSQILALDGNENLLDEAKQLFSSNFFLGASTYSFHLSCAKKYHHGCLAFFGMFIP